MNVSVVESATLSSITLSNLTIQYVLIGFAALVLLGNITIVFVLVRNKRFLKKSAFICGLAFGDTILGVATAVCAIMRVDFYLKNKANELVHPIFCLKTFTTLFLIGAQVPSIMIFLISNERVVSVVFFQWYYNKWTYRKAWFLTAVCFAYCTVSIAAGWMTVYNFPVNTTVPILCSTALAVGGIYSAYNFYLAAFCGLWSAVTTISCLKAFMNKKKNFFQTDGNANLERFIKKQWQVTKSTTCLAVIDFFFVVVPNILISLVAYFPSLVAVAFYGNCMLCIRSASNIIVYLIFNRDFRLAFLRSFGFQCINNSVQPLRMDMKMTSRTFARSNFGNTVLM